MNSISQGKIIIISGPSCVGKNSLIARLTENTDINFIVPFTTRVSRGNETHNKDYRFISKDQFSDMYNINKIHDWDYVLGNYYGFEKVSFNTNNNENYITHELARMALRIKKSIPNVLTIFLEPEDLNIIEERILLRDGPTQLNDRIIHGKEELELASLFDYIIKTNGTDTAFSRIIDILKY